MGEGGGEGKTRRWGRVDAEGQHGPDARNEGALPFPSTAVSTFSPANLAFSLHRQPLSFRFSPLNPPVAIRFAKFFAQTPQHQSPFFPSGQAFHGGVCPFTETFGKRNRFVIPLPYFCSAIQNFIKFMPRKMYFHVCSAILAMAVQITSASSAVINDVPESNTPEAGIITGHVSDAEHNLLPGASISVKGVKKQCDDG